VTRLIRPIAALLVALFLLGSAGCGIPEDNEPRAIAEDLTEELQGAQAGEAADNPVVGTDWIVYVVETDPITGDRRLARTRAAGAPTGTPDPHRLLTQLLLTRDESLDNVAGPEAGLSNQIPADLELVDYRINEAGDEHILTLSPEFGGVLGDTQRLAVAQLVYTATEVGGIQDVRFRTGETWEDSQELPVPGLDNELQDSVNREDYDDLRPELDD
jgi:hypothetical protein